MGFLREVVDFFRGYPPWVWLVIVAAFGVVGLVLVYGKEDVAPGRSVRVFLDREDLLRESKFSDILAKSKAFDIVTFSGNVLKNYEATLVDAVERGVTIRIVMYNPDSANQPAYDQMATLIGETPSIKRDEAKQLTDLVKKLQTVTEGGKPRSIELRTISGMPLLYNLWTAILQDGNNCGHLSTYFYGKFQRSPSFRECAKGSEFAARLQAEFTRVWAIAQPVP